MTLGSALPWRACPVLGRFQVRILLSSPRTRTPRYPRATAGSIGYRNSVRAQSTDHDPLLPSEAQLEAPVITEEPSSLVERLTRVPVRPHGPMDSVLVRPATPYPHKREAREDLHRNHRALTQQDRLQKNRGRFLPGDWRIVLQTLTQSTPIHTKPENGVKVVIPKHTAELLLTDRKNNVWNIKSRTGCEMRLYRLRKEGGVGKEETAEAGVPEALFEDRLGTMGEDQVKLPEDDEIAAVTKAVHGTESGDTNIYLYISGAPNAVAAAVDDILKVTKAVTVLRIRHGSATLLHPGSASQLPGQGLPASDMVGERVSHYPMSAPCRPYTLWIRADEIPRPSEWTIQTFQEYIAALTMSRVHESPARKLYPGEESHKKTVIGLLHDVFEDPDAAAAVSHPAFKLALEYVVRSGETHVPDAQRLFDRASSLLVMDTDAYNLLFEMGVKSKNLVAFESVLKRMLSRGLQPNLRTWLLFLRMIEAEEVRRYILQSMHTKRFFDDPRAIVGVVNEMANQDIYRAIQLGQDIDAFLDAQRQLYGPAWHLTRRSCNRYLDYLGKYGKFDQCRRLLERMFADDFARPNTISLNTVVSHCKLYRKIDEAINFVRMFDSHGYKVVDKITIHQLFELARILRKPHMLGVVWRYAHITDMTNHRLRRRGIKLLAGDKETNRLIDRIRPLWESDRHECDLTPLQFVEGALLDGFKNVVHDENGQIAAEPRRQEPAQRQADGRRQALEQSKAPESPQPHADYLVDFYNETAPATSGTAGRKSEARPETRNPTSTSSPKPAPPTSPSKSKPASEILTATAQVLNSSHLVSTPLTYIEKYTAFAQWAHKKSAEFEPTEPLSDLLQRALNNDRRLLSVAHNASPIQEGLPVNLSGVPILLASRQFPVGQGMGLVEGKVREEDMEQDEEDGLGQEKEKKRGKKKERKNEEKEEMMKEKKEKMKNKKEKMEEKMKKRGGEKIEE
ncbi:hypothetical protein VTI74DRAFT_6357 [Chaetomium olivicolor]